MAFGSLLTSPEQDAGSLCTSRQSMRGISSCLFLPPFPSPSSSSSSSCSGADVEGPLRAHLLCCLSSGPAWCLTWGQMIRLPSKAIRPGKPALCKPPTLSRKGRRPSASCKVPSLAKSSRGLQGCNDFTCSKRMFKHV